ncbi:MAG: hypothetical protein COW08_07525 [Ignavibacteriales bacterium CG12_big_fil_rev_8_21_14_0_65_30_8]|nr:MAG: hypothetical protein COW08_07525 [Ignavibacteriales bacterium CG12_big_fil_rev_8_21_14_0_65_30_8]
MNPLKVFKITIVFTFLSFISIYLLRLNNYITTLEAYSSFWACCFTSVNYYLGMLSIKIGINRNYKVLMISFFGGMLIRLILLLLLVFIGLKFLEISRNIFIFLILFFYILYLLSEVSFLIFWNKEHEKNND